MTGISLWAICCGGHATLKMSKWHIAHADFELCTEVYSDDEIMSAVAHFKCSKILTSEVDPFLLARMKGLTGGVPADLLYDAVLI